MGDLVIAIASWLPAVVGLGGVLASATGLAVTHMREAPRSEETYHLVAAPAFVCLPVALVGTWLASAAAAAGWPAQSVAIAAVLEGFTAFVVLALGLVGAVFLHDRRAERREAMARYRTERELRLGKAAVLGEQLADLVEGLPEATELVDPVAGRRYWVRHASWSRPAMVAAFDVDPMRDWRMRVTTWRVGDETARSVRDVIAPPVPGDIEELFTLVEPTVTAMAAELEEVAEHLARATRVPVSSR